MAFWDVFGGKAVEKGSELIDDMYTSNKENADILRKNRESAANAKTELTKAYAPFKLAQRYLAFFFASTFLFILVNNVLGQQYGVMPIKNVQAEKEFADSIKRKELMTAFDFIKEEEGFREKPYLDTLGVPTFGIGFVYITEEEADWILVKRLSEIETELRVRYRWYDNLNATRQNVLISMAYQLGFGRLAKFKKFIAAMERKDYDTAAVEMLDSLWARQTPQRVKRQANMIKNG